MVPTTVMAPPSAHGLGLRSAVVEGQPRLGIYGPLVPMAVFESTRWLDALPHSGPEPALELQYARDCVPTWGVWVWLVAVLGARRRRPLIIPPAETMVQALLEGAGFAHARAPRLPYDEEAAKEVRLRSRWLANDTELAVPGSDDEPNPVERALRHAQHATLASERSEVRFARAMTLLVMSEQKLAAVAAQVGWSSVGSFVERFTQRIGMTPARFRSAFRG